MSVPVSPGTMSRFGEKKQSISPQQGRVTDVLVMLGEHRFDTVCGVDAAEHYVILCVCVRAVELPDI